MGAEKLRVMVLTGVEPRIIRRLIEQVERECPEAQIRGVLFCVQKPLGIRQRFHKLLRQLIREPGYPRYVAARGREMAARIAGGAFTAALRFANAYSPPSDQAKLDLDQFKAFLSKRNIPLLLTNDVHAAESLDILRAHAPDLGVVLGTPILKPEVFEIPRLGSINVHQRKLPDYRGGGPVGLWELLHDEPEIGVTIHRVVKRVDAGNILSRATIPIDPHDGLESLQLKAHVVSIDLLTQVINDFQRGPTREILQSGPSRLFRSPTPTQLRLHRKQLEARRPRYQVPRGWPLWKLLAKTIFLAPWMIIRNWRRRLSGTFPVVIFFHHLVSDRPHPMGIPTSQFLRHLEVLNRFYDVVDLEVAVERLRSGRVNSPTVVLTFDDGYKDLDLTLRAAALEHQTPFCLFVCTRNITEQRAFDHDLRRGIFGFEPLTWDNVRRLESWGLRIGSHTRTHFDCGAEEHDRLQDEIVKSQLELEQLLEHSLPDFSFPFGMPRNTSRASAELASKTYRSVCSAFGGENTPQNGRARWHFYRRSHPAGLWELALAAQSLLGREPILPTPPWLDDKMDAGRNNPAPAYGRIIGISRIGFNKFTKHMNWRSLTFRTTGVD